MGEALYTFVRLIWSNSLIDAWQVPFIHVIIIKTFSSPITPVRLYRFKNNDIPGREICTLSSLMRVSRILQLFNPLSLNVTILHVRQIYDGILDNLSMPSILVHVLVYLTNKINNDWNRYHVYNVWNIQGTGLAGVKIKTGSASRMSA
jgi:hypothetical protein